MARRRYFVAILLLIPVQDLYEKRYPSHRGRDALLVRHRYLRIGAYIARTNEGSWLNVRERLYEHTAGCHALDAPVRDNRVLPHPGCTGVCFAAV